jgi:nitrate/TMAO reductase-like tetraheme cytochrome c subunit
MAIAIGLLSTAALSAQTMYVANDVSLKSTAGATIGTITPGTKIAIRSASSGASLVTIDGWQPKSAPTVVFANVDSQVVVVRLSGKSSNVKVVSSKNDPYGSAWNQVQVSGAIDSTALVASVTPVWSAASKFYGQKCSQCHTLHQPTEFTANQWPGIVASMAHNAALSGGQLDLVVRYLQAHART